ncbi:MAG: carboxypeptidase-like regulatory domain-containing protein, partial [Bacteroides sp.]|nr:carboxypeptidase-like regulatory domain-containing protein [Bacteroides sp.]
MKTTRKIKGSWLAAVLIMLSATAFALPGNEDEFADTINFTTYYGKVADVKSGRSLAFATIEALGTNVATVSNIDGDFSIKIAKDSKVSELKISYIGFANEMVALTRFKGSKPEKISLTPSSVQLEEVTIRPKNALALMADVLRNIRDNYSPSPMMMRGFYRETILKNKNYASISEAVVDIYKGSYSNDFQVDQVKLFKGRKSSDVEKMDTVLFKVQGGPSTTILLDVIKNPYILLSPDYENLYDFEISDVILIDDKLHYVVSFKQKEHISEPYYSGKFYVDMEKLAITEAEFELNTENEEEAARLFIQRKPASMNITAEKAAYRAKYTIEADQWYFSYARAEVRFK